MTKFRLYFNRDKYTGEYNQWVLIHIGDDVKSFRRRNDCHAYYIGADVRKQRRGLFGHIHIPEGESEINLHELIPHEIQHMVTDWILCRKGGQLTPKNEERIATMTGEINKRFWREYEKIVV